MEKPAFKFLSTVEYQRLCTAAKLAYLSDAMQELRLAKFEMQEIRWKRDRNPRQH